MHRAATDTPQQTRNMAKNDSGALTGLLVVVAAIVGFLLLSGRSSGGSGGGGGGGGNPSRAPDNVQEFLDESTVPEAVRGITDVQVSPGGGVDYQAPGTGTQVGVDLNPVNDPVAGGSDPGDPDVTITPGTGAFPFGRR